MTGSLFDPSPSFNRAKLAESLAALAHDGVFVGASSWKYEGWLGQIYSEASYRSRGRFSKKLFEAECLREYAGTFPTVCGDFAFYQFPAKEFWEKLFAKTPPGFRFAFKVPEQITCKMFPNHARYGAQAGVANPAFLDAALLEESLLKPLDPYRDKTAVLILEFGRFSPGSFPDVGAFLERLDPFLESLPPRFRYAVEVRNAHFLAPAYFDCLRSRRVAHVFNAWSRMPELHRQIDLPGAVTADFVVARGLLRYGRPYEKAVAEFSPYTEIRDSNPEARESLRKIIQRSREQRREAYVYVNNRLEGNAPLTIEAILE
ncbi:MAG: DUF72 domain-containing protein [Bryobacteraceae bacterium]